MDNEKTDVGVGRLALREEGDKWVAYYARPDTMEDAVWLAEIHRSIVQNPARKNQFRDLMQDVIADILETATGRRPTWTGPILAPEHEL